MIISLHGDKHYGSKLHETHTCVCDPCGLMPMERDPFRMYIDGSTGWLALHLSWSQGGTHFRRWELAQGGMRYTKKKTTGSP